VTEQVAEDGRKEKSEGDIDFQNLGRRSRGVNVVVDPLLLSTEFHIISATLVSVSRPKLRVLRDDEAEIQY